MTTKIIVIIGVSVATVVGMFLLGKCADRGNAVASETKRKSSEGSCKAS